MTFIKMLQDDSGASAAEYALILAIVGSGIALASVTLGGAIRDAINGAATTIKNPPATPAPATPA
jgi:pilus assembly protein Flp/PilA